MNEPILILCEGSDTQATHHLCTMCGEPLSSFGLEVEVDWLGRVFIPAHNRRDIIAELRRGDYGGTL